MSDEMKNKLWDAVTKFIGHAPTMYDIHTIDMTPPITSAQMLVLKQYVHRRKLCGVSPTLRQVGGALGKSKSTVYEHLGMLADKGFMVNQTSDKEGYARGWQPTIQGFMAVNGGGV